MRSQTESSSIRKVLHVGCGKQRSDKLPDEFCKPGWREVRLDINPEVQPDVVGDIRDLHMIEDNSVDAVFSSHNIEHLYYHEVLPTLQGFYRVLAEGGQLLIACPDLEQIALRIVEGKLMEPVFTPPAGPIAAIDMLYGYRTALAKGNHFMAHKCGFTPASLKGLLGEAGFGDIRVVSQPEPLMDIVALATKP